MQKIAIMVNTFSLKATLNESSTAQSIWNALPIQGTVNVWGQEIYFDIPVKLQQAPDARAELDVGELAYWSPGRAFCMFFGATPASIDDKPRAASPVNVFGRLDGDVEALRRVCDGDTITVTRIE